ncbi:Methyltransferase domain-containing protein [Halpernia humi]|uniref:Methyltransferase domain-containing protein n=1 Tax=Halpernia humi TaxID=493375 RepID=A0A1H5TW87_9FLAO|nr:methyltransferase domain-containing protein [Halpernia humi]SEF67053.1 Methyltransferase domain-containing protein [Halpernia humi]
METLRKPFQGVTNIIRFNWHFYILSLLFLCALFFLKIVLPENYSPYLLILIVTIFITTASSLLVSFFVYDCTDLYELNWIKNTDENLKIVNINAGFDEISAVLKHKFKNAEFSIFDFYNPKTHTEVSIKRARKVYPNFPETIEISTNKIPLKTESVDKIFLFFAAHEIRKDAERIIFFKELHRILKPNGEIYVTEHLRNLPNFLAYNIGFFHFLPKNSWLKTFISASLNIKLKQKKTPFITTFTLQKNGITP